MAEENQERISKEQYLLKLSILEQQANQLEQRMKIVEQQINEMGILKASLESLKKSKEKEILASLGRGVFLKTEVKDKNLLVDVGAKTVLKKSISETIDIIDKQVKELEIIRDEILKKINQLNLELEKTIFTKQREVKEGEEEIGITGISSEIDKIEKEKIDERKLASVD